MTEAEPRNQREMTTAVLIARPAPPLACLPPLAIRCWPSPRRAAVAAPEVRRGLQLLAGECDQRPEVSLGICGPERRDVVAAQSARFGERSTAPGEPCAAEGHDERIRGQPRPAAVTLRGWEEGDGGVGRVSGRGSARGGRHIVPERCQRATRTRRQGCCACPCVSASKARRGFCRWSCSVPPRPRPGRTSCGAGPLAIPRWSPTPAGVGGGTRTATTWRR